MVLSLVFLSAGLLVIAVLCQAIARAGARGSLPRQSQIGLRTRATKASDAAWESGHRAAAPVLRVVALTITGFLLLGLVVALFGEAMPSLWMLAAGYVVGIAGLLWGARAADQAARAVG